MRGSPDAHRTELGRSRERRAGSILRQAELRNDTGRTGDSSEGRGRTCRRRFHERQRVGGHQRRRTAVLVRTAEHEMDLAGSSTRTVGGIGAAHIARRSSVPAGSGDRRRPPRAVDSAATHLDVQRVQHIGIHRASLELPDERSHMLLEVTLVHPRRGTADVERRGYRSSDWSSVALVRGWAARRPDSAAGLGPPRPAPPPSAQAGSPPRGRAGGPRSGPRRCRRAPATHRWAAPRSRPATPGGRAREVSQRRGARMSCTMSRRVGMTRSDTMSRSQRWARQVPNLRPPGCRFCAARSLAASFEGTRLLRWTELPESAGATVLRCCPHRFQDTSALGAPRRSSSNLRSWSAATRTSRSQRCA